MAQIFHELPLHATASQVFHAITDAGSISTWWLAGAQIESRVGAIGIIPLSDGTNKIEVEVLELVRNQKVVWKCLKHKFSEWIGTSISFEILPSESGASTLRFRHAGWASDIGVFGKTSFYWAALYLRNLKHLVERNESFKIQFWPGHHFGVKSSDLEAAVPFYESLGFSFVERAKDEVVMKCGEQVFSFDSSESGDNFFDFEVANLREAREYLESKGCVVILEVSSRMIFVRDPFGMKYRLCEKLKGN